MLDRDDMDPAYLVQRVLRPRRPKGSHLDEHLNPFTFGAGGPTGGMNEQGFKLISKVMEFDYMGAAEYEFGAMPECMTQIARQVEHLVQVQFDVPTDEIEHGFRLKWELGRKRSDKSKQKLLDAWRVADQVTFYAVCHKQFSAAVEKDIREIASGKRETRDATRICNHAWREPDSEPWSREVVGWLALNSYYFFTVDKAMADGFMGLFRAG